MNKTLACELCGAEIPNGKRCLDLCYQLSFYTLSRGDKEFIHQYLVDAYGASHITKDTKPVAIGSCLIGLYLMAEHGYSGRQAQQVHVALGKKMADLKVTTPPKEKAQYTVADVLKASEGENRDTMIKVWANSVWNTWSKESIVIGNFLHQQDIL